MASDPTRTVSKQVRVIFPDGLPRGLDASQVQLVVRSSQTAAGPEHKRDGTVTAQQNRDGNGSAADDPTPAALPGENEPEPAPADPCPATPPPSQGEAVPLSPPPSLLFPDESSPRRTRAEAARENGRKSRGPVTPEGKSRSSQNALKHGLSSRQVVIGTEEEEEWLEFRDECRQTLKPVGAIELGYVDEFAASRWRLRRCLGIETSIFDYQFAMQKIYDEKRCSGMDGVAKTGMAFRCAKDHLTALGRYETRIRRSGERALANLLRLQSMRQNEPEKSDSAATNQPCRDREGAEAAGPVNAESRAQNEPEKPPALDDSAESTTPQAPSAAVNPQNEPVELATSHRPQATGLCQATSYGPVKPQATGLSSYGPVSNHNDCTRAERLR